jgi:hypothetical protein
VNTEGDGDGVSSIVVLREQVNAAVTGHPRVCTCVTPLFMQPRRCHATPLPGFRILELALRVGRIGKQLRITSMASGPIHGPLLSIYSRPNCHHAVTRLLDHADGPRPSPVFR